MFPSRDGLSQQFLGSLDALQGAFYTGQFLPRSAVRRRALREMGANVLAA
jgi:hypothetical protein